MTINGACRGEEVVIYAVFVTRMEGPCSSATVANFTTRCAARRPHVHGARSALGTEGGAQLPKEESNLGKEGPEDKEERDSQAPEELPFLFFF